MKHVNSRLKETWNYYDSTPGYCYMVQKATMSKLWATTRIQISINKDILNPLHYSTEHKPRRLSFASPVLVPLLVYTCSSKYQMNKTYFDDKCSSTNNLQYSLVEANDATDWKSADSFVILGSGWPMWHWTTISGLHILSHGGNGNEPHL